MVEMVHFLNIIDLLLARFFFSLGRLCPTTTMVDATKIGGAFELLAFVNSCELCDAAAQAARNCA